MQHEAAADAPGEQQRELRRAKCAAELQVLKADLQQLKQAFFTRQYARAKLMPAGPRLAQQLPHLRGWGEGASSAAALAQLQHIVVCELLDPACTLPIAADAVHKKVLAGGQAGAYRSAMAALRQPCLSRLVHRLSSQGLLDSYVLELNGHSVLVITDMNRAALADAAGVVDPLAEAPAGEASCREGDEDGGPAAKRARVGAEEEEEERLEVGSLLEIKSAKEREHFARGEEVLELLDRRTALQRARLEEFHMGGRAVLEPCNNVTKEACRRARGSKHACRKLHKRKVIMPWTDESLGNCSFLDSCNNMHRCKYVHWENDPDLDMPGDGEHQLGGSGARTVAKYLQALQEPQWIMCDVRNFRWNILGKFGVIMTDPPWRIHQDLPYGTMSDDELRNMNLGQLQDDGVIFMWVTARALELGRELLHSWGYKRVDELIWVKINSLRRLIITGRTGHWLNHSKEHCLVGYKGNPHVNRFVDCDVVVSEVRETSRKPDEMYPLLERLCPGTRKLEVFARQHNVRPGWVSLGNQLDGTYLTDPELLGRYTQEYGPPQAPSSHYTSSRRMDYRHAG